MLLSRKALATNNIETRDTESWHVESGDDQYTYEYLQVDITVLESCCHLLL